MFFGTPEQPLERMAAAAVPLLGGQAREARSGKLAPSVLLLLPCVALSTMSATLLLPILPTIKAHWYTQCDTYLIDSNCASDFRRASQYSGLFSSLRFFLIFLVSSFLGRLSDSIGRVPLLRLNNLAQMSYVLALLLTHGKSAAAYFATWTASGLLSSFTFQVVAYIADSVAPAKRLEAFGMIGAVTGAGLALVPLFTAFSSAVTDQDMFFMSLMCLAVNAAYVRGLFPALAGANAFTHPAD